MRHAAIIIAALITSGLMSSCQTTGISPGENPLILRVLPEGEWRIAKIYLNSEYVDTAEPGGDQRTLNVAAGKYHIRIETDNHETWEDTVSVIDGIGTQYIRLHPKALEQQIKSNKTQEGIDDSVEPSE
jgi:hypothetical protein